MKYIFRIICAALALSVLLCGIPTFAAEETEVSETDTVTETPKTVKVVFATEDIPQGTRITNKQLTVKEVPNLNVHGNTMDSTEEIVGKFAEKDVYEGEYIYAAMLSKDMVVKANREVLVRPVGEIKSDFIIVTDYIRANTGLEVEYYLKELVDKNPHRTIYFPAGEYVFGSPLSIPADAQYSVSLLLDDGAVIKAADAWRADGELDALICLGGIKPKNDINSPGSYYSVQGGILDANNRTDGISVESGRETLVRNMCIKNAKIGINVRKGTNNNSSDCDFEDITIIGSNKVGSIGINILAADNTFTTIRIYDMHMGISGTRGGHIKDVYIINTAPEKMYVGTVGINNCGTFVSNCYVENYETAYLNPRALLWDCTAVWTDDSCVKQTAFERTSKAANALIGCRAFFHSVAGAKIAFTVGDFHETTAIVDSIFDESLVTSDSYKKFIDTDIIWINEQN